MTLPVEALAERLTLAGLAVDAIHRVGDWWDPETITVGEVAAVAPPLMPTAWCWSTSILAAMGRSAP